jgi:hypothetical protein
MGGQLPPQFYKPTIKRPEFDASLPQVHQKRQSVIRGAGRKRCQWCAALLPLEDSVCTACGATQIDSGLIDLANAPAWKKRIGSLGGNRRNGYNG